MILFLVSLHRIVKILLLRCENIDITKLEETQILTLAVHIVLNTLQTTKEQCLAHHIQIRRKRIQDLHTISLRIGIMLTIIGTLCQRIVQNLIEPLAHQLFTDSVSQFVLLILITLDDKRTLQLCWDLYIIISIDTQDILHNIAGTLHINTIGRNLKCQGLSGLVEYPHLQTLTDTLDSCMRNFLTHKVVNILITEFYDRVLHRFGIDIANIH